MKKTTLIIIDPQMSFCHVIPQNEQQLNHDGELCVPGAWDDMTRLSELIRKVNKNIKQIQVTLDSHHVNHIAHPSWFLTKENKNPLPFTQVTENNGIMYGKTFNFSTYNFDDIGELKCSQIQHTKWTIDYLRNLTVGNRYPHTIWAPHCLIGTIGHAVVPQLFNALYNWELNNFRNVDYTTKGSNPFVEHFSAVKAEVVHPEDPEGTQINTKFIDITMNSDEILLAGEARSHCLANTVRDIAYYLSNPTSKTNPFIEKCVLLTDATSDVPGFESYGESFVKEMVNLGMKTATCAEYMA